jgi:hypothetical protein
MTASVQGNANSPWTLLGTRATLAHCGLNALVDVAAPSRGLAQLKWQGDARDGHLLGVDAGIETSPDDAYVRGADLVVVYRETTERTYTVQVYWTVGGDASGGKLILDATVSIQTRQWEAYPRVSVTSDLVDADAQQVDETALIRRPHGADFSYVEVAPALDFHLAAPNTSGATAWEFRDHFMERGVIRQLRVRGALVRREDDQSATSELQAALLTEAPPLTA